MDSLQTALKQARHDTTRLRIYSAMVETEPNMQVWKAYNEKINELTQKGLATAQGSLRAFYLKYQAIYLNNRAYVFETEGNPAKAIELYQQSLGISKQIGDKLVLSNTLNNLGYVHKLGGRIQLAIEYYEQSIELKKELGDKKGEATLLNNIGIIYHSQGNLARALDHYLQSVALREELGDKRSMASTLNGIGGVYEAVGDTGVALGYYRQCLKIKEALDDKQGQVVSLGNIANIHRQRGDSVTAFELYRKTLRLAREVQYRHGEGLALNNLGVMFRGINDWGTALAYFEKSIALREEIGDRQGLANSLVNAGGIYEKRGQYQKAIGYYMRSLGISRSIGFTDNIRRSAESLYRLYKTQGNATRALEMHELFKQMTDSISSDNARKEIFKSQFRYEYEKKAATDSIRSLEEKKLFTANLEKERASERAQKYALTALIIAVLMTAIFVFQRFRHQQKMKELKIRNKIASDLHDEVGSALSSISLLSGMAGQQMGADNKTIRKIEETSRETLENMSDIVWSIQPRNDRLANVVKRMKTYGQQLFGSLGIAFEFKDEGEPDRMALNMEQRKNLYLVYKEALNNAAKYADAQKIQVSITCRARNISLTITDDGKGFDTGLQHGGNGLYTMQERARALGGNLQVQSRPGSGTTVVLDFKTT